MLSKIKTFVKVLLSYILNGHHLVRFSRFGKGSSILKGLIVNHPQGVSIYDKVRIGRNARLSCYPIKGEYGKIVIKDNCYIGDYFSVITADWVEIEEDVLFASFVTIIAENHGMDPECGVKYGLQELSGKKVLIKDHCWIGEKVIVMPGVTIGSYSIIGAGSVVTQDIPDYCIAVGNPAKVIKKYSFKEKRWVKIL